MRSSASRYATVLAALRMFTGLSWLSHGIGKLLNPQWNAPGGGFASFVGDMTHDTSGAYHDFVTNVVLTHASVFGGLVAWGETLTGVSLLLGLLTRLGGAGGAFLTLNYWAAKSGFLQWTSLGGLDLVTCALSVINAILPTGLVWGVDGVIAANKRPPATGTKT